MTKNTPRIFISLLLMLLCIGILPVSAFASDGDYPDDALPTAESSAADAQETKQIGTVTTNGGNLNVRTGAGLDNTAFTQLPNGTVVDVIGRDGDWVKILLPARVGYVYGGYLTVTDAADSTVSIGSMTGGSDALTPDGNLTLIDDIGSSTKVGKQFITLESKNGNTFYLIIDRDDEGEETVHFLNQVDEADLLKLMDEEEAAQYIDQTEEPDVTEPTPDVTEPEPDVVEPEPEKPKTNMMPAVLVMVALIGGGGFFVFKKMQEKKKEKEAAKPDPDADYVDDDEDYGYSEEYEDDDVDFIADDEDNEPV